MPAISRFLSICLFLSGALPLSTSLLRGQDADTVITAAPSAKSIAPTVAPLELDIARRDLKNFLTADVAGTPSPLATGEQGMLREVFVIGSANISRAVFWDPSSCRLIGVLDLNAPEAPAPTPAPTKTTEEGKEEKPEASVPSPYLLKASGSMPLTGSSGASGAPGYFGFRLVGGMPEFLYTFGSLAVEERLWLDEEGNVLKQRFAIPGATKGFQITIPEDWKKRVSVSAGEWKGNTLSVPADAVTEIILSYRLIDPEPEPVESN